MSQTPYESEAHPDAPLVEPTATSLPAITMAELDAAGLLGITQPPVLPNDSVPYPANDDTVAGAASADAPTLSAPLNILAVVSLILVCALSPLAVIFGYLAVGQIRRSGQRGEALAWTAIGFGWIWLVGYVVAGSVLALTWFQLA